LSDLLKPESLPLFELDDEEAEEGYTVTVGKLVEDEIVAE
jgi:hypothetical protein